MTDIRKEIRDWKASFVSPMTPAEADGYDMVVKCEKELRALIEEVQVLRVKANDLETIKRCLGIF